MQQAWRINHSLAKRFLRAMKGKLKPKIHEEMLSLYYENEEHVHHLDFALREAQQYPKMLEHISSEDPALRSYAIKHFERAPKETQLFYMQQIVECGGPRDDWSSYKRIEGQDDPWSYLIRAGASSVIILNQLEWVLRVSLIKNQNEEKMSIAKFVYFKLLEEIKKHPLKWEQFSTEQNFFKRISKISAELVPGSNENSAKIKQGLEELTEDGYQIPKGIYLPTDPNLSLVGVKTDSGVPLQSAKRTPILVVFYTTPKVGVEEAEHSQIEPNESMPVSDVLGTPCIFKVNDDVRNDQLCLQFIELMKEVFKERNLPIYLRPYKVISTIIENNSEEQLGGIIECIPNCKSRDEIGKEGSASLYEYFVEKFGMENSEPYEKAKKNFIESLAGYAIASYMLQIKDRHNGNILIDEYGHIVHIDFGFILSISPGGNMRFERPGFKLTKEMIDVMGKDDSEAFEYFKELVIKGYFAIRDHSESFISLIATMQDAGFTCFRKNAVKNLVKRFYQECSFSVLLEKLHWKISRANNSIFTVWYDRIQLIQQQIEY